jgi:hypothetical protein
MKWPTNEEQRAYYATHHGRMDALAAALGNDWAHARVSEQEAARYHDGLPHFAVLKHPLGCELWVSFEIISKRYSISMRAPGYGAGRTTEMMHHSNWVPNRESERVPSITVSDSRPLADATRDIRRRLIEPLAPHFLRHMERRAKWIADNAQVKRDYGYLIERFAARKGYLCESPTASELSGHLAINGVGVDFKSSVSYPDTWELELRVLDKGRLEKILTLLEEMPNPKPEEATSDAAD